MIRKRSSPTNLKRTKTKSHKIQKTKNQPTKPTRISKKETSPLNRTVSRNRQTLAKTKANTKTHPTSKAIQRRKNRTPSKIPKILSKLNVRSSPTHKANRQLNHKMLRLRQKRVKKANSRPKATSLLPTRQMLMTKPSLTIKPTPLPRMTVPTTR